MNAVKKTDKNKTFCRQRGLFIKKYGIRVSEKPLSISPVGERTEAFPREGLDGVWYTLDGRKLAGKPNAPGIYVKDGRKVAMK